MGGSNAHCPASCVSSDSQLPLRGLLSIFWRRKQAQRSHKQQAVELELPSWIVALHVTSSQQEMIDQCEKLLFKSIISPFYSLHSVMATRVQVVSPSALTPHHNDRGHLPEFGWFWSTQNFHTSWVKWDRVTWWGYQSLARRPPGRAPVLATETLCDPHGVETQAWSPQSRAAYPLEEGTVSSDFMSLLSEHTHSPVSLSRTRLIIWIAFLFRASGFTKPSPTGI